MPRIKDMMGYRVERLEVIGLSGRDKHGAALWKCKCDCGNIRFLTRGMLIYGRNKSCGCYKRERMSNISKSEHYNGDFIYSGIDRKDNEIGYTLKNCVPCCIICNRAKNSLSFDEFLAWIGRLVENNK